MKTLAVTDFTGRLTRVLNGDINSGFAKFNTSWGYDPFSKPGNLTWNYQPSVLSVNQAINASLTGVIVGGVKTTDTYSYVVDTLGQFLVINDTRTITNIGSPNTYDVDPFFDTIQFRSTTIPDSYNRGASMIFTNDKFFIGGDGDVNTVILDSNGLTLDSSSSVYGSGSSVLGSGPHPLVEWQGKVYYGNINNIGEIDPNIGTYGTITNGAVLSPPIPDGVTITDLDITPEGDYMLITGSFAKPPQWGNPAVVFSQGGVVNYASPSQVYYWNGSDKAVTAVRQLPAFPGPALSTFLDKQYTFMQDAFGMGLMQGNQKVLTLPNNTAPTPGAMTANSTFLTWISAEGLGSVNASTNTYSSVVTSLYYFGYLDEESPVGLWRMFRDAAPAGKVTISAPLNYMVNNFSMVANIVQGFGKHYFSSSAVTPSTLASVVGTIKRFVLNPAQVGLPQLGTYETQTQLFSKRIAVADIRVYCDPAVAGNAFQLDIIGSNGNPVANGTFTYTFGDIVDPQSNSTSVERINFSGNIKTQYSLGIRITNTGTTNMTIRKVEIDYEEKGK